MDNNTKHCVIFKNVFVLFLLLINCSSLCAFERKLNYSLNPDCNELCNSTQSVTVVHVTATGPNDTLHYVWDFEGKPSILMAITSHEANLSINWNEFLFGNGQMSVHFTEEPIYSFGIIINKIIEFNDVADSGSLNFTNTNETYVQYLHSEYFDWKKTSLYKDNGKVVLIVQSSKYENNSTSRSGNVRMILKGFGFLNHAEELPRLLHSANSTVVEIEIDNLETEPTFTNSRFAVEFLMASSDKASEAMSIDVRKSLDDEQSPGVFTLVDLVTPSSKKGALGGGFLQWRPVAYISRVRSLANSTETTSYDVSRVVNPEVVFNNTLLEAFYGYELINDALVQQTTISFGLKEDGFYKKTNYTTWSFSFGFGQPPDEDFSLPIILVICIGLGLPALLILISSIVFVIRRITRKNDELCLSR